MLSQTKSHINNPAIAIPVATIGIAARTQLRSLHFSIASVMFLSSAGFGFSFLSKAAFLPKRNLFVDSMARIANGTFSAGNTAATE